MGLIGCGPSDSGQGRNLEVEALIKQRITAKGGEVKRAERAQLSH